MAKYIIKDWANNICFHGKEFDDFDDADAFLIEFVENDILREETDIKNAEDIPDEIFFDYKGEYYIVESTDV